MKKIEKYGDLPPYGQYVLVYGKDHAQHGEFEFHVCEMNDLEDGLDFEENGDFYWITEKGTMITEVEYWMELPKRPF